VCSASTSPVNGASIRTVCWVTESITLVPISRLGTEYRAEPNRTC
jgi:hypothetical protein